MSQKPIIEDLVSVVDKPNKKAVAKPSPNIVVILRLYSEMNFPS